ncbi:MAG TPA: hypothetical protein VHE37_01610 [Nevskiaceae bacterium]|nr:hypothetical protein [Nevskiaceae bacterium]
MGKTQTQAALQRFVPHRQGEGALLSADIKMHVGADGKSIGVFSIDLKNAPTPDRKYVADLYDVVIAKADVRVLFAQSKVTGEGIRSLLVIHLSPAAIRRFLNAVDDQNDGRFEKMAERLSVDVQPPTKIQEEPAGQTVAFSATAVMVAVQDYDACLDFMKLSAFSLSNVLSTKQAAVEPIVRTDIHIGMLVGLLRALREAEKHFPKDRQEVGNG